MSDLRTELETIRKKHGKLTPDIVLTEASAPKHPLHSRFEWDDTVAAHKYRVVQAHELLRVLRVKYIDPEGHPASLREFHAVRTESGFEYRPIGEIVEDEMTARILQADMEREWRTMFARWSKYSEFLEMVRKDVEAA